MPHVNNRITVGRAQAARGRAHPEDDRPACGYSGKKPETTVVAIDEVDTDKWEAGGEQIGFLRGKSPQE